MVAAEFNVLGWQVLYNLPVQGGGFAILNAVPGHAAQLGANPNMIPLWMGAQLFPQQGAPAPVHWFNGVPAVLVSVFDPDNMALGFGAQQVLVDCFWVWLNPSQRMEARIEGESGDKVRAGEELEFKEATAYFTALGNMTSDRVTRMKQGWRNEGEKTLPKLFSLARKSLEDCFPEAVKKLFKKELEFATLGKHLSKLGRLLRSAENNDDPLHVYVLNCPRGSMTRPLKESFAGRAILAATSGKPASRIFLLDTRAYGVPRFHTVDAAVDHENNFIPPATDAVRVGQGCALPGGQTSPSYLFEHFLLEEVLKLVQAANVKTIFVGESCREMGFCQESARHPAADYYRLQRSSANVQTLEERMQLFGSLFDDAKVNLAALSGTDSIEDTAVFDWLVDDLYKKAGVVPPTIPYAKLTSRQALASFAVSKCNEKLPKASPGCKPLPRKIRRTFARKRPTELIQSQIETLDAASEAPQVLPADRADNTSFFGGTFELTPLQAPKGLEKPLNCMNFAGAEGELLADIFANHALLFDLKFCRVSIQDDGSEPVDTEETSEDEATPSQASLAGKQIVIKENMLKLVVANHALHLLA